MQVFVKYNKTVIFDVIDTMPGMELQIMVSKKFNIPIDSFYLKYATKIIYEKPLIEYNITECSTITVELRRFYKQLL